MKAWKEDLFMNSCTNQSSSAIILVLFILLIIIIGAWN
ncbi:MAG: YjcZ family sporulation protein [Bacilli bacterium]|nr:YjcZ family sporulation protein [Bacilli bacterium]